MLRNLVYRRSNVVISLLSRSFSDSATASLSKDVDSFAISRKETKYKCDDVKKIAERLITNINCTKEEALTLIRKNSVLKNISPLRLSKNSEFLLNRNVKTSTIIENPWLLGIDIQDLANQLNLVEDLNPRNLNDFVPLARLSIAAIARLKKTFAKERDKIPEGNRIYYFSKRLNVEPALTTKYFSTHLFMFKIPFETIEEILQIMLEFEIPPQRILRDLWAFNYKPTAIRARLEHCQKTERSNLKPWMIRCTEGILEQSLKLTKEKKTLLGDVTLAEYLSERLNVEVELMNAVLAKNEAVKKVKVAKIKNVLDYILLEEKFEPSVIVNTPRIFCHSLNTTKQRIEELKAHGFRPQTLSFVCLSQTMYNALLASWIERRNRKEKS